MNQVGLQYQFEWRLLLFTLVCFSVFVRLGFWQLDRADYKRDLAADYTRQSSLPSASVDELIQETAVLSGRKVRLQGVFLPEVFLLDNQIVDGQFGNDVIQLFRSTAPEHLFLVNRGWVPADPSRLQLTQLPERPVGEFIEGRVYIAPGTPFTLAGAEMTQSFPKTVQSIDLEFMTSAVDRPDPIYPHLIRLATDDSASYRTHWALVNTSPEKHIGYAVQWFAMAAALALLYVHRSTNIWALIRPASGEKNDYDTK